CATRSTPNRTTSRPARTARTGTPTRTPTPTWTPVDTGAAGRAPRIEGGPPDGRGRVPTPAVPVRRPGLRPAHRRAAPGAQGALRTTHRQRHREALMGGLTEENVEPETLDHIRRVDCYACARRGDRWFLCDYHQGYDDA